MKNINFIFAVLINTITFSQTTADKIIIDSCAYYITNGNQIRAIKLLSNLESTFPSSASKINQYKSYRLLGKAFQEIGDPNKAAAYYTKGLELAKANKSEITEADFYIQLANVNTLGLPDLSLNQIYTAENIYKKLNNKDRLLQIKYRKGNFFSFTHQVDSANYYYRQIISECEAKRKDTLLQTIYMNMGVTFSQKGDKENYRLYMLKALSSSKKINDRRNISLAYANYAIYFNVNNKNFDSSLYYSNEALKMAYAINFVRSKLMAYENIIDVYKQKKDYKTAFLNMERFKILTDSFKNASKDIASLKNQMESDFKDKENQTKINHLLKEKESAAQLIKQRQFTYTVMAILIIMLITALILYNRFKVIQKQKGIIEHQNNALKAKNTVIEEKQKEILDSIHYAKRIQTALMSNEKYIDKTINRLTKK